MCLQIMGYEPLIDCGTITLEDDQAVWETTHACVIDAYRQRQDFRVVVYFSEEGDSYALVGLSNPDYSITHYQGDPDREVWVAPCTSLEVTCDVSPPVLCIKCNIVGDGNTPCG